MDRSHSMIFNDHIGAVNRSLQAFRADIMEDPLARKRLDLCVISFNHECVTENHFCSAQNWRPPTLVPGGATGMGQAIKVGLETLRGRLQRYRLDGVDCYRPWVMLVTDGLPTDMQPNDARWMEVRQLIQDGEQKRRFMFFSVAVLPEAIPALRQLGAQRPPLQVREGKIPTMFKWLSASFSSISRSQLGAPVSGITEPTATETGWADIPSL
ncbi:von Willebrand factor, type A [Plesiocystis pacifica SIR-1]|uniref:von Willebrand factor, type A n=2 Tax=Plesiocystis pacifica TaxID=191768 RepID=A6G3C6_9BACT|nr:von Willebrand factor, type A [Plesiocystis pacifica SIR-1]